MFRKISHSDPLTTVSLGPATYHVWCLRIGHMGYIVLSHLPAAVPIGLCLSKPPLLSLCHMVMTVLKGLNYCEIGILKPWKF